MWKPSIVPKEYFVLHDLKKNQINYHTSMAYIQSIWKQQQMLNYKTTVISCIMWVMKMPAHNWE